MGVNAYKRDDNTRYGYSYDYWISNFASKKLWDDFIRVDYIDLVQVKEKQNNGKITDYKVMSLSLAKELIDKYPNVYSYIELDNEDFKTKDYFKYNPQSFLEKILLRIRSIKQPIAKPKKKIAPFNRNELIGLVGVVIMFVMLILYIIVEKENIF